FLSFAIVFLGLFWLILKYLLKTTRFLDRNMANSTMMSIYIYIYIYIFLDNIEKSISYCN
ncbi:MAG: hypothetical protein N7Q72_06495, partial [Spiroplasma sp. Tabriz.8]|nr:hypothetical protein [Spiroplasma sp. Tabriz.8]